MNWEVIGAVSELIGALAVIASLVYLAYQVRQHTRVIQSSSFQATTDSLNHINMTIASEVNCRDRWRQEKPVRHGRRLRAAAAIALFASGFAAGAALNDALDAAKTAPHIYRTVLENERLRVLDVTVRNGEMAPLHSHPDRLIVYLNSCAWLETTGDGERRMQSFTTGDVAWEPGMMHGGEPNNVVHDCRQLEIELKDPR